MSPAALLLEFLRLDGLVAVPCPEQPAAATWYGSYGLMPDGGDRFVTFYDGPGLQDVAGHLLGPGPPCVHPGVTVRVRSPVYGEASGRAWLLADRLCGTAGRTVAVGGTRPALYRADAVWVTSPPHKVAREQEDRRTVFGFDLLLTVTVTPA